MTTFQFLNDLPFSWQCLELQTATSRKEGPTESRLFGSLKYWTNESVSFLRLLAKVLKPKTILKRTARCTMFVDPQDTFGRPSEGFTLVRSSELVGPARGSRVWFPNKDSQSIASKVLPNLGIPKHGIAWKKKWHETQGPHPLQPVQPFFLSDEQRSPAVAIKQQTARSATAGFGFSHASGAPHSRGIIVMVIKSHPPDLSIYLLWHTFTCFKPSRLSTLG